MRIAARIHELSEKGPFSAFEYLDIMGYPYTGPKLSLSACDVLLTDFPCFRCSLSHWQFILLLPASSKTDFICSTKLLITDLRWTPIVGQNWPLCKEDRQRLKARISQE